MPGIGLEYGIAGLIGEGLKGFADSYGAEKDRQRKQAEADDERAQRKRQMEASDFDNGRVWDADKKGYKSAEGQGFLSKNEQKQFTMLTQLANSQGEMWQHESNKPYREALRRLIDKSMGGGGSALPGGAGLMPRDPDTARVAPKSAGLLAPQTPRQKQIAQTEALGSVPAAGAPAQKPLAAASISSPYAPLKQKIAGRHAPGFKASEWGNYVPKAEKEQRAKNEADLLSVEMKELERDVEGPKQNQAQAGSFARSAKKAEDKFAELVGGGFNRADAKYSTFYDFTKVPYVGGLLANLTPSDLAQQNAAERAFLNSIMRRDSGATIPPSELAEGSRLYFPRPGDDAKTLEFKRQNRIGRIAALEAEAGPGLMEKLAQQEAQLGGQVGTPKGGMLKPDFSKMSDEELKAYTAGKK